MEFSVYQLGVTRCGTHMNDELSKKGDLNPVLKLDSKEIEKLD